MILTERMMVPIQILTLHGMLSWTHVHVHKHAQLCRSEYAAGWLTPSHAQHATSDGRRRSPTTLRSL